MRVIVSQYSFLIVILSFFLLIFSGGLLLFCCPGVIKEGALMFIDALFISVSAVTGTGVSTIDMSLFTQFGKVILILLMYIGSVGILTILLGFIFYFSMYNIEWYGLATEILTIISIETISRFLKVIFITTIFAQLFGMSAFLLLARFLNIPLSFLDSLFLSINFFCNVGFSVNGIVPSVFSSHIAWYAVGSLLIIIGSCGFLLFFECQEYVRNYMVSHSYSFSITSKLLCQIYFLTSILLWIFYFFACEVNFSALSLMRSFFAAISLRSCGVVPYVTLPSSIVFISALCGVMGSAPFGTGGGIKTSVCGVIVYTFLSFIKKENIVIVCAKKISWQLVAFAHIFLLYITGLAMIVSIIIDLYRYHQIDFLLIYSDILGLITGSGALWTPLVSEIFIGEKIICIVLMCIGKIAAIGLSLYLSKLKTSTVKYPDAKLIII